MMWLPTLFLMAGLSVSVSATRTQQVRIRGEFFCQSTPERAHNITVKLIDQDDFLNPDDFMGETTTNNQGKFSIKGSARELTSIDPQIRVFHDCNDGVTPCQREWTLLIPNRYINGDEMDLGRINLDITLDKEKRDCIH